MAQTILEEALQDAELLEETAFEYARNVLAEAISPQIREFMDSHTGGPVTEMPADLSDISPEVMEKILMLLKNAGGAAGGHDLEMGMSSESDAETDMNMMDDEESSEMPYGEDEEDDEEKMLRSGMYQESYESEKDDEEEEMSKKNEASVKLDESDLAKAWAEVVKEEALEEAQVPSPTVAPGFADQENPNTNATGGLGERGAPGERGLEDKEKEEMWKDNEPTYAQDWTVKEGLYRQQLAALYNENKSLKAENQKLSGGIETLQTKLTEVNLFNAKMLYTSKLLQSMNLTNEQRLTVIESIDRAESIREAELVYKSLSESFKIAGVTLSESKQHSSKRPRSSRFVTSATKNMLKEQNERKDEASTIAEGWQKLAGLIE